MVGFSSDDFNQEAKDEAEAATMCFINYGVKFTMLAPQHVKGPEANTVFKELARQTQEPQWNFNKYLVTADGKVAQYFDSRVAPDSQQFNEAVEKAAEVAGAGRAGGSPRIRISTRPRVALSYFIASTCATN